MLSFLFGFLFGVVSTVAWAFGIVPSKTGSAMVLTSSVSSALVFVLVNVLVLDIVLLLPSIGSAVGLVKKVKATLSILFTRHALVKPALSAPSVPNRILVLEGRHASDDSLLPVAVILVAMFRLHLASKAAATSSEALAVLAVEKDPVHVVDEQGKVPGAFKGPVKLKEFMLGIPALSICICLALSVIACDILSSFSAVLSWAFAQVRCSRTRPTSELDDEADTTLVDESEQQSQVKTIDPNPAPLSPVFPSSNGLPIRASLSAPGFTNTGGERPRLRTSTTSLQVGSGIEHSPAVSPSVSASSSLATATSTDISASLAVLDPTALAFVPAARSSAVSPSQAAPNRPAPASPNQEWVPKASLSFAWARGGCTTRITAPPPPPTLKADVPAFVPRPRPAAPASSPAPALAPVAKPIALRGSPPSFWAPGGRAVPIIPPQDSSA